MSIEDDTYSPEDRYRIRVEVREPMTDAVNRVLLKNSGWHVTQSTREISFNQTNKLGASHIRSSCLPVTRKFSFFLSGKCQDTKYNTRPLYLHLSHFSILLSELSLHRTTKWLCV